MQHRRAVLSVKSKSSKEAARRAPPGPRTLAAAVARIAEQDAIQQAIRIVQEEDKVTLEGVWPGAVAPLISAWRQASPDPTLVIVSQVSEAEGLAAELEELLGSQVDYFPPGSDETELESLAHRETTERLNVISRLYHHHSRAASDDSPAAVQAGDGIPLPLVVTTHPAILQPVPSPGTLERDQQQLEAGRQIDLTTLREWLVQSGYHATSAVQLPGEFAIRGGIFDVFPPDESLPVRVELFDDEIESLRSFDVVSQRSIEPRQRLTLLAVQGSVSQDGSLLDFLPPGCMTFLYEQLAIDAAAQSFLQRVPFPERFASIPDTWQRLLQHPTVLATQLAQEGYLGPLIRIPLGGVERIGGDLERLSQDIDFHCGQRETIVSAMNEGEQQRLQELLADSDAARSGRLTILTSQLQNGFEILPDGWFVLTAGQLLHRSHVRRNTKRTKSKPIDSFLDLRTGDLVVHLSHGIGVYRGTELLEKHGQKFEHLVIEFDGGTRIFVPSSKIELVQRYVGGTKSKPKLAKIGGQSWARQKKAAQQAVQDMASELLELQARRGSQPGIAFADDSVWQNQFDASFSYVETPDQISAIAAVKQDMLTSRPMDRLICGDVGFGKTEIAMRAAFKAVDSGYQVAVLVPTTVLAEQHYKSFRERMAEFPFDIAKLSRFASSAEQRETLKKVREGGVDIVVGTHRLASKDLQFYNLGLLIIDEEQRFGVAIKERLKHLRSNVDVMTLSATPIPRTLHMSLVGARDISNLETPPRDRLSIETRTIRFDESLIRNAVLRELNRGGQIYFVHNRVQDIEEVGARLQRIVPEARMVIGHGQMEEGKLEQVMIDFIGHRYDLLLATTIIESGLDIPNANTIFIDEANRYGLSELHQLRGRVGRHKHQAYCYLLVDRHKHLTPDAARRLHAIEEFSKIGSGFGIAMRDLEIRGAGNLLGTQQSGHIAAVGYELYCQMLGSAVRELTHQPPKFSIDVDVDIPVEAFLPVDYVPELRQRIDVYRRLSRVSDVRELDDMRDELADRFGELPKPVEKLLSVAELKIDASIWFVKALQVKEGYLVLGYSNRSRIAHLAKLHDRRLRIVDHHQAYWVPERFDGRVDWLHEAQTALRSR